MPSFRCDIVFPNCKAGANANKAPYLQNGGAQGGVGLFNAATFVNDSGSGFAEAITAGNQRILQFAVPTNGPNVNQGNWSVFDDSNCENSPQGWIEVTDSTGRWIAPVVGGHGYFNGGTRIILSLLVGAPRYSS